MLNVTGAAARLPPELLAMVFEQTFWLCDEDHSRSKTRADLSATCSLWRNVALASRILWSSIYLHTTFGSLWRKIIDTSLEHSGTSPLTITIIEEEDTDRLWKYFKAITARLVAIFPRTRTFRTMCDLDTLHALRSCFSTPAPELEEFSVTTPVDFYRTRLPFFPSAPKLKVLHWSGFRFRFDSARLFPTLASVSLEMGELHDLVEILQRAPQIEKAILRIEGDMPPRLLEIPALRNLELTCPDASSAPNLLVPALETAVITYTLPRIVDLRSLVEFAQCNAACLLELSLTFAGDFSGLGAVLAHCRKLSSLRLGKIGWSTSFVASFLRELAVPDDTGEWVCGRLEELELRVLELESAVRTALMKIAEGRRADAPEDERPERPLRSITVVRSDDALDMARPRNNYAALNKKLDEILRPQNM